jgi:hypothetical protein
LKEVIHRSGDKAAVDPEYNVTKDWVMHDNWSDSAAFIQKAPRPPFFLTIFYSKEAKQGPYHYSHWTGLRNKPFEEFVKMKHQAWVVRSKAATKQDVTDTASKQLAVLSQNRKK